MKKNKKVVKIKSRPHGITAITVRGFKSICDESRIEIRPLTVLAGANSSGKSSIMQPLLLLKQTLEAGYDPGPLLLDGPNVKITSADQLISNLISRKCSQSFSIGIEVDNSGKIKVDFIKKAGKGIDIEKMTYDEEKLPVSIKAGMSHYEIMKILPEADRKFPDELFQKSEKKFEWSVFRDYCFLKIILKEVNGDNKYFWGSSLDPPSTFEHHIRNIIHIPGLRGNPERRYKKTSYGPAFPGTFENYVASIISEWQSGKNEKLKDLMNSVKHLELTWKIEVQPIDDTQIELKVGRLKDCLRGGARDLVNIADVGFGVSQSLPVLAGLHAARAHQLVYIEQPELHLHPRAQFLMAEVLAEAALRGVRVVAETHSSLLLLGIQTLVAERKLSPDLAKLHWFKRDKDGVTNIISRDFDETGAFGDWPEDFGDLELEAQSRYLDAVESIKYKASR